MRLTLLIDHLGAGGAQRQASALHQAWVDQGIDARLVYYRPHHHFVDTLSDEARERVTYLETSGPIDRLRAVRNYLDQHPPDVLISFLVGPTLLAYILDGLLRPKWRWIVSERSALLSQYRPMRRRLYTRALQSCDRVVPNSKAGQEELIRAGVARDTVEVVPNGLQFSPAMQAATTQRSVDGELRLLMVGTISRVKNHRAVLRALGELEDRAWTLDLVGRTTEPEVEDELRSLVKQHAFGERVRFHGTQSDVGAFYARADLLLLPSTFEGFPNVILETWAWGCPPLVSRFGDLPELVGDGERGIAVDVLQENALRDALRALLDDPSPLRAMADNGFAHVRERYPLASVAAQWAGVAQRVLNQTGSS